MKKYLILSLEWLLALVLAGCLGSRVEKDYPAAIMVDGAVYYVSVAAPAEEVDEESIVGSITSYTDTFPSRDNQCNFTRELPIPVAKVAEGMAVYYEDAWHVCFPEDEP